MADASTGGGADDIAEIALVQSLHRAHLLSILGTVVAAAATTPTSATPKSQYVPVGSICSRKPIATAEERKAVIGPCLFLIHTWVPPFPQVHFSSILLPPSFVQLLKPAFRRE